MRLFNLKKPMTAALLLLVFSTAIYAQKSPGGLMVFPKRVVFEGGKRNDIVNLVSQSDDTASYAISFTHVEMQKDGEFKDADSLPTKVKFCDSIVRFFPRQVTIPPHGSQTICLQYLKPKDLPAGEFRSHLFMREIERAKALEIPRNDTDKTIAVAIKAIYGISIPVIVRNQTTPARVSMGAITVTPMDTSRKMAVTLDLNRSGDESVYGQFIVMFKDKSGKETQLTFVKGIAVYVPLPTRTCTIPFRVPKGLDLAGGTIRVEYLTMPAEGKQTKETVLASGELALSR